MEYTIEKTFENDGNDFSSIRDARKWLDENGYSYGPMCAMSPIAILKGNVQIAKWRNLSTKDKKLLHGHIEQGNYRSGPARVLIK